MDQHTSEERHSSSTSVSNTTCLTPNWLGYGHESFPGTEWWPDVDFVMPVGCHCVQSFEDVDHIPQEDDPSRGQGLNNDELELSSRSIADAQEGTTKKPPRRTFPCPARAVDLRDGLVPTCSDLNATSMSDLRRHLKSLHFFIERCTVCKNNILDQQTFTALHGKAKCTASGKQPILQALDDSYEALFAKVAEMSYTERNSRR